MNQHEATRTLDVTLLRPAAVITLRGCRKTQLYREIQQGLMPPGIIKGRRWTVWPRYEIEAINRAEIAGATADEKRELVRMLMAQRRLLRPEMPQQENAAAA
jgi:prophage regulatory protein